MCAPLPADADDSSWLYRKHEYTLEELGPWEFALWDEGCLCCQDTIAAGPRNIRYYVAQRFYWNGGGQPIWFVGTDPSGAGEPVHDTLGWWLDLHGGVDAVLDTVAARHEPPQSVALQWNPNGVMHLENNYDWDGSWELLEHDPYDDGWMIYVNEEGEEGIP